MLKILKRMRNSEEPNSTLLVGFSILQILLFAIPYFLWTVKINFSSPSLYLRAFSAFLCISLLFKEACPEILKRNFSLYWYFCLFFCLPFLSTYIFLENSHSIFWLLNFVFSISLLMILVDFYEYITLLTLGALGGVGLFIASNYPFLEYHKAHLIISVYSCLMTTLISYVLLKRKMEADKNKIILLQALGGTIAHEMATPLSAISLYGGGIKKHMEMINFPQLIQHEVLKILEEIETTIQKTLCTVEMLTTNLYLGHKEGKLERFKASWIIRESLSTYPFVGDERKIINLKEKGDFFITSNKEMLRHVFYNLIKNSLYYTKNKEFPHIEITIDPQRKEGTHLIIFKDNGSGIPLQDLPFIFEPFFSKRQKGTGLGLAFCKRIMESLGGDIKCISQEGSFTEFILYFPGEEEENDRD